MVLDADIIAAALKFFGMTSSDDKPTKHSFDGDFMRTSLRVLCLKYFNRIVQEFIQTFVADGSLFENHFVNVQALQEPAFAPKWQVPLQIPRVSQFIQT